MSVIATTPTAQAANARSLGAPIHQAPRAAAISSHGTASIAASANTAPPAFYSAARSQCPRTACAHDVVIPQDGQRVSNSQMNVHGGNPSCRWVPSPAGLGCKQAAVVNGPSRHIAAAANASRRRTESRSDP